MNKFRNQRIVSEAYEYIENHIHELLPVTELAKHFGYSNHQFIRIFKEISGSAPSLYIRVVKLELAKQWLTDSEMTVSEIADRLGYSSVNNFSRMFQNMVGMNPTAYRNHCSANVIK